MHVCTQPGHPVCLNRRCSHTFAAAVLVELHRASRRRHVVRIISRALVPSPGQLPCLHLTGITSALTMEKQLLDMAHQVQPPSGHGFKARLVKTDMQGQLYSPASLMHFTLLN